MTYDIDRFGVPYRMPSPGSSDRGLNMKDEDKAMVVLAGKELPGPCLRAPSGCKCQERYHRPGPFRYWCMCCWEAESDKVLQTGPTYVDVPKNYNCDGSLRNA